MAKEIQPESFEPERTRQADRLVGLGFHRELQVSEEEYRASLPKLENPFVIKEGFEIPVIVDPRVPLKKQYELAGVKERTDSDRLSDITEAPDETSYLIWTHDGRKYTETTVANAKRSFDDDEVGCTQTEATALLFQQPELFENYNLLAPGSQSGRGVPSLRTYYGTPIFSISNSNAVKNRQGILTRGKDTIPPKE